MAARPSPATRVYRGIAPNPTVALAPDLGVVTSFLDSGRTNGQIYYYKVTALNAIGESLASNEANATPPLLAPPLEPLLPVLDSSEPWQREPVVGWRPLDERHHRLGRDGPQGHVEPTRVHEHHDVHRLAQKCPVRPGRRVSARSRPCRGWTTPSSSTRACSNRDAGRSTGTCSAPLRRPGPIRCFSSASTTASSSRG